MRNVAILAALTLGAACSSGISVQTDYDPRVVPAMGQWKTFAMLPAPPNMQREISALVAGRIESAIEAVLIEKGYTKASGSPDFRVGWHASTEGKMDVTTVNDSYGYGWRGWYGPSYSRTYTTEYKEGTLIVDIVDPSDNELAFRAIGSGRLQENQTPEQQRQNLMEALREMLQTFPPTP